MTDQVASPEGAFRPAPRRIGCHPGGARDYFGPLVVAACYLEPASERALRRLRLGAPGRSDRQVGLLAEKIRVICPVELLVIGPARYNQLHAKMKAPGELLAWAHAKAALGLLRAYPGCVQVLTCPQPDPLPLEEAMKHTGGAVELQVVPEGTADPATEAARILARAEYLRRLGLLFEEAGLEPPSGSPPELARARELYRSRGLGIMRKLAKLHLRSEEELGEPGGAPRGKVGSP